MARLLHQSRSGSSVEPSSGAQASSSHQSSELGLPTTAAIHSARLRFHAGGAEMTSTTANHDGDELKVRLFDILIRRCYSTCGRSYYHPTCARLVAASRAHSERGPLAAYRRQGVMDAELAS